MKKLFVLILLTLNYLIAAENAPPKYWWGLNVSGSYVMHDAQFTRLLNLSTCCPEPGLQGGSGLRYSGGVNVSIPINDKMFINTRLAYHDLSTSFDGVNENIANTQVRQPDGTVTVMDIEGEHLFEPALNLFSLEPVLQYQITDGLFVVGGLRFGYFLDGTFNYREELKSPQNVTYTNGSLVRNLSTNVVIEELNTIQLAPVIGAGYSFHLNYRTKIVPEFRYYYSVSEITNTDWKVDNLTFGITYERGVVPPKKKQILRDTVYVRDTTLITSYELKQENIKLINRYEDYEKEVGPKTIEYNYTISESYERWIPKEVEIDISIETYGLTDDGKKQKDPTIVIEEIESEEGFPLLPFIYFNEGSDDLKKAGLEVLSKNEFKKFDPNGLEMNVFEVYKNTLNVIAKRLLISGRSITIIGYRSNFQGKRADQDLVENRIQSVKKYLVNNCGIESNKIATRISNKSIRSNDKDSQDIYDEAQSVEIVLNDPTALEPVYIKDIVRNATPPSILIESRLSSDEGIKKWDMTIDQFGDNLRNYSGSDTINKTTWNIAEEPIPTLEENIDVNLVAVDNLDHSKEEKTSLKIKQLTIKKKREVLKDDKRIEKYSLIVFDYNQSRLKPEHQSVIDYVKDKIKPNSVVTISGYADRTGESDYNNKLSERRCQEVYRALKDVQAKDILTKAYGNSLLLYDNDTALGRALSRTVQIEIETPVSN